MKVSSKKQTVSAGASQGITLKEFIDMHTKLHKRWRTSNIHVAELWTYVLNGLPYKLALSRNVRGTKWYIENIKRNDKEEIFYETCEKEKADKRTYQKRIERWVSMEEAIKPYITKTYYSTPKKRDEVIILYSEEENKVLLNELIREIKKLEVEESKSEEPDLQRRKRLEFLQKDKKDLIFAMGLV